MLQSSHRFRSSFQRDFLGDPLLAAASVAGLVSFGLQHTERLIRYHTAYRGRDADLAKPMN